MKVQIPIIIYLYFLSILVVSIVEAAASNDQNDVPPRGERVDCAPRPGDTKEQCIARGCLWDPEFDKFNPTVPLCFFPWNTGYVLVKDSETEGGGRTEKDDTTRLVLEKSSKGGRNPYDDDFQRLQLSYRSLGGALHLKISPILGTTEHPRFVPPVPLNDSKPIGNIQQHIEKLQFITDTTTTSSDQVFSFRIKRPSDDLPIWDTSIGGLLFADRYIQIATWLPTDRVYGIGEHIRSTLKHDFSEYRTWAMWSRDQPPYATDPTNVNNLYGTHPFYLAVEPSGKAHGVLIMNSNAQEFTTGPGPHLVYRTIGGQLDIYFLPGPSPEEVVQQYQQLVGRPYLPAYWTLGYQFCRYGYNGLDDMRATIDRIRQAQIPLEVAYADIDYMDHFQDFSVDPAKWGEFPSYVQQIHDWGMRLVLITDPAIDVSSEAFKRAREKNASFIEWERWDQVPTDIQNLYPEAKDTKIMLGVVWPDNHAAFPDFLDPTNQTQRWWADEIQSFHEKIPFDGLWIDMNEPAAMGTNELNPVYPRGHPSIKSLQCPKTGPNAFWDEPPYKTKAAYQWPMGTLSEKSLCLGGMAMRGKTPVYNTHNLYGWSEAVATLDAVQKTRGNRRTEVISRSTFPSSGRHGSHWLGDNFSEWPDLRASIIGVMEFNMFGIPHVGADVCGFIGATTEELCLRWQQLGAFYPFYRNHNADESPPQDPPQWKSVAVATRAANLFRYRYLPYLYTLMFRASRDGASVFRPLFFEFPADPFVFHSPVADRQFLWGSALLVVPVLEPNVSTVRGYLPLGGEWFALSDAFNRSSGNEGIGKRYDGGQWVTLPAPRDTPLPVFIRGGLIVPGQHPALTTGEARLQPRTLVIALARQFASNWPLQAHGEMFWDDGETAIPEDGDFSQHSYVSVEFEAKVSGEQGELRISIQRHGPKSEEILMGLLDEIDVFGLPWTPQNFTVNGQRFSPPSVEYVKNRGHLKLNGLSISLDKNGERIVLEWTHQSSDEGDEEELNKNRTVQKREKLSYYEIRKM